MDIKQNLQRSALSAIAIVLAACTCPQPSVMALPQPPKPTMPAELAQPLPEPLHFQTRLQQIFVISPATQTK